MDQNVGDSTFRTLHWLTPGDRTVAHMGGKALSADIEDTSDCVVTGLIDPSIPLERLVRLRRKSLAGSLVALAVTVVLTAIVAGWVADWNSVQAVALVLAAGLSVTLALLLMTIGFSIAIVSDRVRHARAYNKMSVRSRSASTKRAG